MGQPLRICSSSRSTLPCPSKWKCGIALIHLQRSSELVRALHSSEAIYSPMTRVLRCILHRLHAQVDAYWRILCLVPHPPGILSEGRHMVSMMSLLSDQASSPICNFNENQTPALQQIAVHGINSNSTHFAKHSSVSEALKPLISCYQRPD